VTRCQERRDKDWSVLQLAQQGQQGLQRNSLSEAEEMRIDRQNRQSSFYRPLRHNYTLKEPDTPEKSREGMI
jgi:hypothetical protein